MPLSTERLETTNRTELCPDSIPDRGSVGPRTPVIQIEKTGRVPRMLPVPDPEFNYQVSYSTTDHSSRPS